METLYQAQLFGAKREGYLQDLWVPRLNFDSPEDKKKLKE